MDVFIAPQSNFPERLPEDVYSYFCVDCHDKGLKTICKKCQMEINPADLYARKHDKMVRKKVCLGCQIALGRFLDRAREKKALYKEERKVMKLQETVRFQNWLAEMKSEAQKRKSETLPQLKSQLNI